MIWNKLKKSPQDTNLENKKKHLFFQTFTYYIPAPPKRKTGYREKEFDQVISEFINQGFKIESIHTAPHSSAQMSGMWLIALLSTTDKSLLKTGFNDDNNEFEEEVTFDLG